MRSASGGTHVWRPGKRRVRSFINVLYKGQHATVQWGIIIPREPVVQPPCRRTRKIADLPPNEFQSRSLSRKKEERASRTTSDASRDRSLDEPFMKTPFSFVVCSQRAPETWFREYRLQDSSPVVCYLIIRCDTVYTRCFTVDTSPTPPFPAVGNAVIVVFFSNAFIFL